MKDLNSDQLSIFAQSKLMFGVAYHFFEISLMTESNYIDDIIFYLCELVT